MKKAFFISVLLLTLCLASGCALKDRIDEYINDIFPEASVGGVNEVISEKPNVISAGIFDFDTFNPLITNSQSVREAMEFVYEPLFTLDENLRTVPVLAKDFSVLADGKTIVVNIKEGVKWHDGSDLTAQDVAYTFKVIKNGQTNYTHNLYNVRDYRMLDDYIIQISLSYSVPNYENMLTFPIVKYRTDMQSGAEYIPNGTGPFCYGTKASTNELYFGAFDAYHGSRANIDALYITMAPSYEQYMTMLEASEIDFSSSNIVDLTEYMPRGSLTIYDFNTNELVFLGYNMQNPALSGSLTRRGISEIIDKDAIVDTVIFSRGTAVDVPINPSSYLYYDTDTRHNADELTANDYLGNDGWGSDINGDYVREVNGAAQKLSFEILTNSDNARMVSVAEYIAEELNNFGIKVTVNKLPYDYYTQRINAKNYDMFVGAIELDNNLDLSPLAASDNNMFGYSSGVIETLCAQMGMTRNEDELKTLFRQYGDTLINDMPFCALYFKKGSLIASANVKSGISPTAACMYRNSALWSVR